MKSKKEKKSDISPLEKRIQELEETCATLQAQLEDAQENQIRALADLQNFQRRETESKTHWSRDAVCVFVEKILPRLNELEISQSHTQDTDVQKTINNFFSGLKKLGLEKINPKPETTIDPEQHEVLMVIPGPSGCVVQTLEPGWKYQDHVITPAKVSAGQE